MPGQKRALLFFTFALITCSTAFAQIVVTTNLDSGPGSLRDAVTQANTNVGPDDIVFDPSLTGQTITLDAALTITSGNGNQTAISGDINGDQIPDITITRSFGPNFSGIVVQASNCTISYLHMEGFTNASTAAINLDQSSSTNNFVIGNYIGTDISGNATGAGNFRGIALTNSASNNHIGDGSGGGINVIGNNAFGIYINGADNNIVSGNYIGMGIDGSTAIGNAGSGVEILNSTGSIIGVPGDQQNIISNNNLEGISLTSASGTNIRNNYIGTDVNGLLARGNSAEGILLDANSSTVSIGDGTATGRNVIGSNGQGGIVILSGSNTILNNYIGVGSNGSADVGNTGNGVWTQVGSVDNFIGDEFGGGNIISANSQNGVLLSDGPNFVYGNIIGLADNGSNRPNSTAGVTIAGSGSGNKIGDAVAGAGNTISSNTVGIAIVASGNDILGNIIGLDVAGANPRGNAQEGISLGPGSQNNNIGDGTALGSNIITENGTDGILISAGIAPSFDNTISNNSIFNNAGSGIRLVGSQGGVTPPTINSILTDGTVNGTSDIGATVEVYVDFSDEGQTFQGSTVADGSGNWVFNLNVAGLPGGQPNATAIQTSGSNSSAFSLPVQITDPFTVVNTSDAGLGSLRWVIGNTNAISGVDNILFNIPNSDPNYVMSGADERWTITPLTALPDITEGVVLDGNTQPGTGNFRIRLDGNGANFHGITVDADNTEIYSMYISGFNSSTTRSGINVFNNATAGRVGDVGRGNLLNNNGLGLSITFADNYFVQGNLIGVDETGTTGVANHNGIRIASGVNNTQIGGLSAGEENVISGNTNTGVLVNASSPHVIQGNFIGTDITGTVAIPNATGVSLGTSSGNLVQQNIISGNTNEGIQLINTGTNTIQGNLIGTAANGTDPIGNGIGIEAISSPNVNSNIIGGINAGEANVIAFNVGQGILLDNASHDQNQIRGNSIFCNGIKGIDLNGVANTNLAAPNITNQTLTSVSGTGVDGDIIDVYRDNSLCAPIQGAEYLGSAVVGTGVWVLGGLTLAPGDLINATATDVNGNTSEFAINSATFYSQSAGAFDVTTRWNTASDGSGSNANTADFTSGLSSFIIQNSNGITAPSGAITINNLTIGAGGALDPGSMDITINGTTDVSGTFQDTNSGGTNIFGDRVTVNSGGAFSSTAGAHDFRGGITNNGTFGTNLAITSVFSTNSQTVVSSTSLFLDGQVTFDSDVTFLEGAGESRIGFGSGITINGTVTNQIATGFLNLRGDGLTVNGNLINDTNARLYLWAASPEALDATAAGNTVNYFRAGAQDVLGQTYHNLILSASGVANTPKTFDGNTIVNGNLEITDTDLVAGGFSMTVAGDFAGSGTSMVTSNFTRLTMNGASPQTINVTGFDPLIVDGLTIDNASGVTLQSNLYVDVDNIDLNAGNLIVDGGRLEKDVDVPFVGAGSFGSAQMIAIANGGVVRLNGPNNDPTLFPIGTGSVYTPLTVTLTSFTDLGTDFYDITTDAVEEPNVVSSGLSLSKYWNVVTSGMNNITASVQMEYDDAEIQGTEANYIPGYFETAWQVGTTSDVTEATNTAIFSHAAVSQLNGNYTVGEPAAFISAGEIAVFEGPDDTGTEVFDGQASVIDFGTSPQGTDINFTFTIRATGGDINVSSIVSSGSEFVISGAPTVVSAGTLETFTVTLPGAIGNNPTETITINNDDADEAVFNFDVTGLIQPSPPKMYWTEETGDRINRSELDGSLNEQYYTGFSVFPLGIAIDTLNNEIFWTDNDAQVKRGTIGLSDFSVWTTPVDESGSSARAMGGIALDVPNGKMYWASEWTDQIRRANFDGTTIENLVTVTRPFGIALDLPNGKMYYTENDDSGGDNVANLWRANLDGSSPELLYTNPPSPPGVDFQFTDIKLNPLTSQVYWSGGEKDMLSAGFIFYADIANVSGTVQSFVTPGEVGGLDLDLINGHVFWVNKGIVSFSAPGICRADLDGSNMTPLLSGAGDNIFNPNFITLDLRGLGALPVVEPEIEVFAGTDNTGTAIVNGQVVAVDFGSQVQGSDLDQVFAIENTGTSTLNITSIAVGGADFSILAVAPTTVAVGATENFTVRLSGAAVGPFNDFVTITNDDADEGTFTFPITGNITATPEPEIEVFVGTDNTGTAIVDGQTLQVDIGSQSQGSDLDQIFAIENTGTALLTITSITVSGTRYSVLPGIPTSVAVGTTENFSIRLGGGTAGTFTTTVNIASDDANESTFNFDVTGTINSVCPTATAGPDQSICPTDVVVLAGTIGGGATTSAWSSGGTGTFDDATILNATYTPSAADVAVGSITITLTTDDPDGAGPCNAASSQLIITISQPITAVDQTSSVDVGQTTNINPGNGATLNAGDAITTSIITNPTKGAATVLADQTIDYTPNTGTVGADQLEFEICNQCNECSRAFANIDILNAPPAVQTTTESISAGGIATIDLLPLISDLNDNIDLSSLRVTQQPLSGAVASIDGSSNLVVDYSGIFFTGTDEVTIEVCDFSLDCASAIITIEIAEASITAYNALSPNGDDQHDFFEIQNIEFFPSNRVTIFNRWGDEVYSAEGYDNNQVVFTGIADSGSELPSGTYYYSIVLGDGSDPVTGFIVISR